MQTIEWHFLWVLHAQVHDHVEVAADLARWVVHPYDVQVGFDVWFVYPAEVDGLVVQTIRERMTSWVHGVHGRCISGIAVSCFVFGLWRYTNLWLATVAVVDTDQGTGHAIAVVLVIYPWVVLQGQDAVTWPGIDKAGAVSLQVLERNQVVVTRDQTLEGITALRIRSYDLSGDIIACRWHYRVEVWRN